MKNSGLISFFPNVLHDEASIEESFPEAMKEKVSTIVGLIAENEKNARKFLKLFSYSDNRSFRDIPIVTLNEHTKEEEIKELCEQVANSRGHWGAISDCGMLCLADPGAMLVRKAREYGIDIDVTVGPSSIVFALMLSGFSAQKFAFLGYLERDVQKLTHQIKKLSLQAKDTTLVFIEAPYRNEKLLKSLLDNLDPSLSLCVASDLMSSSQEVIVDRVSNLKKSFSKIAINKRPTVFLLSKP